MCKLNKSNGNHPQTRIDLCMKNIIHILKGNLKSGYEPVACCCGHNKYPMSIVIQRNGLTLEMFSGKYIPRTKKFYKKDKQGYYYIPETIAVNKKEDDGLPRTDESVRIRPNDFMKEEVKLK